MLNNKIGSSSNSKSREKPENKIQKKTPIKDLEKDPSKCLILKIPMQRDFDDESLKLFTETVHKKLESERNCSFDHHESTRLNNSLQEKIDKKEKFKKKKKKKFIDFRSDNLNKIKKDKKNNSLYIQNDLKTELKDNIKETSFQIEPTEKKVPIITFHPNNLKLNFDEKSDENSLQRNDSFVTLGTFDLTDSERISPCITQRGDQSDEKVLMKIENYEENNSNFEVPNPPNSYSESKVFQKTYIEKIEIEHLNFEKKKRIEVINQHKDLKVPPLTLIPKAGIKNPKIYDDPGYVKTPSFHNQSMKSKNSRKCSFDENPIIKEKVGYEELSQYNSERKKAEDEEERKIRDEITYEKLEELSRLVGELKKSELERLKEREIEHHQCQIKTENNNRKMSLGSNEKNSTIKLKKSKRRNSISGRRSSLNRGGSRKRKYSGERPESKERLKEDMLKRLMRAHEGPRTNSQKLRRRFRADGFKFVDEKVDDVLNNSLRF